MGEPLGIAVDRGRNGAIQQRRVISLALGIIVSSGLTATSSEFPRDCVKLEEQMEESSQSERILPPVEMKFLEERYGKPPLSYLFLDITLRNQSNQPRWFILPEDINDLREIQANKISVSELRGEGSVVLVNFDGINSFYGVLLPSGATVTIRSLPISYRYDSYDPSPLVSVEVVIADRLIVDGKPIESWLEKKLISDGGADVNYEKNPEISSWKTPNSRSIPVTLTGESCIKLIVDTSWH
ncbi:hypothetical protein [Limnofasciculus baicalensis]|uniref:Uncharacterized protein n=1 Tax=Limnofasciculus baicalensis BBK-W-15 TaxID=2699891 RepID=A0AAE3GQF6_9CYAN|nr:hypothetical protein [Limnofasciculus baicalensis]MCP2728031.1 hypothetical protein [Limnofasciculus baicalensis BBK-W-15]